MKHDFYLFSDTGNPEFYDSEDDTVDIFRLESGFHNGPRCKRCNEDWCMLCEPYRMEEDCAG